MRLKKQKQNNRGFTLIELLVVIAIIAILSAIIIPNLRSAQSKARDAKRMDDLHQIQLALEYYKADKGKYPIPSQNYVWSNNYGTGKWSGPNSLGSLLAPYLSSLPVDPVNTPNSCLPAIVWFGDGGCSGVPGYVYAYSVSADGQSYDLFTFFENSNPADCAHRKYRNHVEMVSDTDFVPIGTSICVDFSTKYTNLYSDHA